MKKVISAILGMILIVSLCCTILVSATDASGLSNFVKVNTYTSGQYTDVPSTSWCAENVKTAYEYGIMQGTADTLFDTDGNLTIAQTIAMASRIHSLYYADGYPFAASEPWYKTYIDYAVNNGIVSEGYSNYDSNYSSPVSRAGFALILNGALPDEAVQSINSVQDESIPDVTVGSNYYNAVYRLYRAGVLTGNDTKGTFTPFSKITRAAAAVIVSRMVDISLRKNITLKISQFPTGISLSASKQSIYPGKGFGLTASVMPISTTDKTVTWRSSNRSVATVDASGYVYGTAAGIATITATTSNGKTASCTVTVVSAANLDNTRAKSAYSALKSAVKFPNTLKVHNVWGYNVDEYDKIEIEYSAENNYGVSVRNFFVATFNSDGSLFMTKSYDSARHTRSDFLGTNLKNLGVSSIK